MTQPINQNVGHGFLLLKKTGPDLGEIPNSELLLVAKRSKKSFKKLVETTVLAGVGDCLLVFTSGIAAAEKTKCDLSRFRKSGFDGGETGRSLESCAAVVNFLNVAFCGG